MKKAIYAISAAVLILLCTLGGTKIYQNHHIEKLKTEMFPITKSLDQYPVDEMQSCMAFDSSDKAKHIGFVDYAFVARVDELVGTTYEDVTPIAEGKISATAFTNYKVTVLKNIKGNLKCGTSIPLRKLGGIDAEQKTVSLFSNDCFPEKGGVYIFLAYADSNGELYIADPDSNILLSSAPSTDLGKTMSTLTSSPAVNEYVKAYKQQDNSIDKGMRYKSNYDEAAVK